MNNQFFRETFLVLILIPPLNFPSSSSLDMLSLLHLSFLLFTSWILPRPPAILPLQFKICLVQLSSLQLSFLLFSSWILPTPAILPLLHFKICLLQLPFIFTSWILPPAILPLLHFIIRLFKLSFLLSSLYYLLIHTDSCPPAFLPPLVIFLFINFDDLCPVDILVGHQLEESRILEDSAKDRQWPSLPSSSKHNEDSRTQREQA